MSLKPWKCRQCGAEGDEPDSALIRHPHGHGYRAPCCDPCGSYFSAEDIARAVSLGYDNSDKVIQAMVNQQITPTQRTIAVCTEIEQERLRQVKQKGFDAEHDDGYQNSQLISAAIGYAAKADWPDDGKKRPPRGWPWLALWWKPGPPRRMLIKACALLVAEIERQDRAAERRAAQIEDDAGAVGDEG